MKNLHYINDTQKETLNKYLIFYENREILNKKLCKKKYLIASYSDTGFEKDQIIYVGDRQEIIKELLSKFVPEHVDNAYVGILSEHNSIDAAIKYGKKFVHAEIFCFKKIIKKIEWENRFLSLKEIRKINNCFTI